MWSNVLSSAASCTFSILPSGSLLAAAWLAPWAEASAGAVRPKVTVDKRGPMEEALPFDSKEKVQYPVSVAWQPPFTIMVDLVGRGELLVRHPSMHCTELLWDLPGQQLLP